MEPLSLFKDRSYDLAELARTFPILREAPGLDPWACVPFARWTLTKANGTATQQAGLFILGVWNIDADWWDVIDADRTIRGPEGITGFGRGWDACPGRFNLHRALGAWDHRQRAAFLAWAAAPWWL